MVRSLYRVYLYSVLIILVYFTAISTAFLVGKLFEFTPLNSPNVRPFASSEVTQSSTFASIAWFMTLLVGGLHYWLLRRDERGDPTAGPGPVRAFMVNFAQGLAALIAVIIAFSISLQVIYGSSVGNSLGVLLIFTLLFALFQIERQRTQARTGAALALQRIHFYILPVFLLAAFVLQPLIATINSTLWSVLLTLGVLKECNAKGYPTHVPTDVAYQCSYAINPPSNLGAAWLIVALLVAWWAGYAVLARGDTRSNMRPTMRVIGYTIGVILILAGVERALEFAARAVLGLTVSGLDLVHDYAFAGPLVAGLVVAAAYVLWLRADIVRWPDEASSVRLSAHAMTAAVSALVFYSGCYFVLSYIVERVVPGATHPDRSQLATAVALTVAGVGYIPLALALRRATTRPRAAIAPRRAFGLALLAIGTLTTVIALIVLLYATITAGLGNPTFDWQHLARSAACALAVGVVIVAIYLRLAFAERWLAAVPRPEQPEAAPASAAPTSGTVEAVLDELLAGQLTREQAAARIHALQP